MKSQNNNGVRPTYIKGFCSTHSGIRVILGTISRLNVILNCIWFGRLLSDSTEKVLEKPTSISSTVSGAQPSSSNANASSPSLVKQPELSTSGEDRKSKLLKLAPVVTYDRDLQYWGRENQIEATPMQKWVSLVISKQCHRDCRH